MHNIHCSHPQSRKSRTRNKWNSFEEIKTRNRSTETVKRKMNEYFVDSTVTVNIKHIQSQQSSNKYSQLPLGEKKGSHARTLARPPAHTDTQTHKFIIFFCYVFVFFFSFSPPSLFCKNWIESQEVSWAITPKIVVKAWDEKKPINESELLFCIQPAELSGRMQDLLLLPRLPCCHPNVCSCFRNIHTSTDVFSCFSSFSSWNLWHTDESNCRNLYKAQVENKRTQDLNSETWDLRMSGSKKSKFSWWIILRI